MFQMFQFKEPQILGSEDCLWINVYTPSSISNEEKLRPVLVWIYGGRFLVGTASSKIYSPDFMLDHDLVVVSIQYRVGPYGFLSTGDSVAPGNYGFHDQVLALKWVKANIEKFGGDPDQVSAYLLFSSQNFRIPIVILIVKIDFFFLQKKKIQI